MTRHGHTVCRGHAADCARIHWDDHVIYRDTAKRTITNPVRDRFASGASLAPISNDISGITLEDATAHHRLMGGIHHGQGPQVEAMPGSQAAAWLEDRVRATPL